MNRVNNTTPLGPFSQAVQIPSLQATRCHPNSLPSIPIVSAITCTGQSFRQKKGLTTTLCLSSVPHLFFTLYGIYIIARTNSGFFSVDLRLC